MVWKIVSVDAKTGHMTITNAIEYVDMWNEAQNREATRYDSRSGDPPPAEFAQVASTVGKPLAEITVDRHGRVIKRDDGKQHDLGTGGLLVPLPEQPVAIDAEWSVPGAISVRLGDGTYKTVKTRQLYKLEKVQAGVATITTKTQLLTPNIDSRMRSQLMQKMTEGRIRFDLDAGRILSRQLDWDEDVVGFNGPQSNMEYLARHTEELTDEPKVAQRP